jgi:Zn-finger nucleic acid-binding protein
MLTCPRDGGVLVVRNLEGSQVRQCASCQGLWIGYLALERLADLEVRRFLKLKAAQPGAGTPLQCPADGRSLTPVFVEAVEIDCCPACHGSWLDRLELERIRTRLRGDKQAQEKDDELLDELADADLDPGFLKRAWRWIQDHLPDDWGDGELDFD